MAFDPSNYPKNWKQISQSIRDRAGNKCEHCGLANGQWIVRSTDDPSQYLYINKDGEYCRPNGSAIRMSEIPSEYADSNLILVVLTVAHLDQDTTNNDPANLKALCQRCHLNHDRPHNIVKRTRTRLENKRRATLDSGQLPLLD